VGELSIIGTKRQSNIDRYIYHRATVHIVIHIDGNKHPELLT